jgi:acyl-coenzyme A synthetase/AMP-(fatty) acid ligase
MLTGRTCEEIYDQFSWNIPDFYNSGEVEFIRQMPMTKSGKILKQELRKMHQEKTRQENKT